MKEFSTVLMRSLEQDESRNHFAFRINLPREWINGKDTRLAEFSLPGACEMEGIWCGDDDEGYYCGYIVTVPYRHDVVQDVIERMLSYDKDIEHDLTFTMMPEIGTSPS